MESLSAEPRQNEGEKASPPNNYATEISPKVESETASGEPPSASKATAQDPGTIPDGGTAAWLQVAGAFFLFFNTFGITNTFGIYQGYYDTGTLISGSHASISWISSLQAFFVLLLGVLTGPLYDAGHTRLLIAAGTLLLVFGQMMISICHEYYQVILAQAVCMGVGAGCLFVPSVAVLSQYFHNRLALATGLAACGSSISGILYPIILNQLIPKIGFAWATRTIGFLILLTLSISMILVKPRVVPPKRRRLTDLKAFQEAPYSLFSLGCFFGWLGLYVLYFYVNSYSISRALASEEASFYLVAYTNTGGLFGRLLPNYLADKAGAINVIFPVCFISGILAFCLIPIDSFAAIVVVSILYGFFSGAMTSLFSTVYVKLSLHKRELIGTRMGMGLVVSSVAILLGAPIAGWILGASSYTYVWVFAGLMLCTGGFFMAASRFAKTWGQGLFAKA